MEKIIYANDSYSYEMAAEDIAQIHRDVYGDPNYVPSSNEVYEELDRIAADNWNDVEGDLMDFFNNSGDVFILQGYAARWNGKFEGGSLIYNYNDLTKAWGGGINNFKIYEEGSGTFRIDAVHHDGVNKWTVRRLTNKGKDYLRNHYYDNPKALHSKLFSGKGYSKNLHFFKKEYRV